MIKINNAESQPNNPLHGITLKMMLEQLQEHYGWAKMGLYVDINCFTYDPSIKSSLNFLRRNEWARKKVERLYLDYLGERD
ncbi:MAG: VF530 family protein [Spirochaetales bacterium]|uniref:VF530 family protein n=1 Tax=Candidatus Thalassospirochaeta sargassi TaxID=3119039 RepID=A0AAJ1ICA6_9SPIO|nr:VF530 family protein [Spirochaetales bacterium]